MLIRIKDADTFRCAVNARADKDFQAIFRYVRLGPKGAVSGTDGFVLAHNPNGCEPFESEGDVFVKPQKNVPNNAHSIEIDTEAGQVRYLAGSKNAPGVVLCEVTTEGTFPDVERVIPAVRRKDAGAPFALNVKFVERLTKGIDGKTVNNGVTFEASGPSSSPMLLRPHGADPELILLIMPLRTEGNEYTALRPEEDDRKAA